MKKYLMMFVALVVALAVAMPALAAVELKYGGQFRTRWITTDNQDGTEDADDNKNLIDQRLRLYFNFVASENLRVVSKFEIGDTIWGDDRSRTGPGTGGGVGADAVNVETKNAYVEFGIPNTVVTASVGIQGLVLLDSWIIDDDFSAAVVKANFDPIKVAAGYIAAQNSDITDENENIDAWYLSLGYAGEVGPGKLSATLVGYYQNGHQTIVSTDVFTLNNPATLAGNFLFPFPEDIDSNDLFDVGLNLGYKMDWMSVYLNGVKNFGSVDLVDGDSADYEGWMVDAGANFFYGPFTFNVGGFYTTGQDQDEEDDIEAFTYPLASTKYFSEIVGGGILDKYSVGHTDGDGDLTGQWSGYGQPSNLWTVTAGVAWQALEQTKLAASYWYFGTAESVEGFEGNERSIGHEVDLYLTQGIVDGLTLDLVGAYLFADDAYTAAEDVDDVYEIGARLQWNF